MGRDEYMFATRVLRVSEHMTLLKTTIAGLCLSMAVLGALVQMHPLGPHGTWPRLIHLIVSSSAVIVAGWWLWGRWPVHAQAVAFVVWADVSVAVGAWVLGAPPARICATAHMGLIGLFAGVLLGKRVLAAHCAFAAAVITALTFDSVRVGQARWFDLDPFFIPTVFSVVIVPVFVQTFIDGARRMARATAREALRDPMTGLYNRRGMYSAVRHRVTATLSSVLVVALLDLDDFKYLNDVHGHDHGDAVIGAVTDALRACVRAGDVVARVGGDEFVVIAVLESTVGVGTVIDRISLAVRSGAPIVTASTGIAVQHATCTTYRDHTLDIVLRHADSAMYTAKRRGGNHIIVAADQPEAV